MAESPIELEGAGGRGRIIRSALTLSLVTGKGFVIEKIFPEQDHFGVHSQNLAVVQAAADISSAEVEGNDLNSTRLSFLPGKVLPGEYTFNVGTAGSTVLLLQTLCLPLALAGTPSVLTLHGGTHVPFSPPCSYLEDAWLPGLHEFGIGVELQLMKPGFFPRGGGILRARIRGDGLAGTLNPGALGELEGATVRSITGNLPFHVGERQLNRIIQNLKDAFVAAVGGTETLISEAPGTVVQVIGHFTSGRRVVYAEIGKKGQSAEEMADLVCDNFLEFLDSPGNVDEYAADQMMIPLALSPEAGEYVGPKMTDSMRSASAVIEAFLPGRIVLEDLVDGGVRVRKT